MSNSKVQNCMRSIVILKKVMIKNLIFCVIKKVQTFSVFSKHGRKCQAFKPSLVGWIRPYFFFINIHPHTPTYYQQHKWRTAQPQPQLATRMRIVGVILGRMKNMTWKGVSCTHSFSLISRYLLKNVVDYKYSKFQADLIPARYGYSLLISQQMVWYSILR